MVTDMVADMEVDKVAGMAADFCFGLGGVGLSQFAASKIRFPNVSQMLSSR